MALKHHKEKRVKSEIKLTPLNPPAANRFARY